MSRLSSLACAVAIALSSQLSAFEIPLYEQISANAVQAESPEAITISEEATEQEGLLHLANSLTSATDLTVAFSPYGFSLIRQTGDQLTELKEYSLQDLELSSLQHVTMSADGSTLFVFQYSQVVAYSVALDGTLTKLATRNSYYYNQYRMDASSSYIETGYASSNINISVHSFDKATGSFVTSSTLLPSGDQRFAIYDETKAVLVVGYYDYSSSDSVVRTYKADSLGQLNLVSQVSVNEVPYQQNVAYIKDSGNLLLMGYSGTQLQVANDGSLQQITANNSVLPENYPSKSVFSGNTLYVSYGDRIQAFSFSGTAITKVETLSDPSIRDITALNGSFASLQENSLSFYPQGLNSSEKVTLKRGQQSLSLLPLYASVGDSIMLNDNYFFRASDEEAELYKKEADGKIKSLKFFENTEFYPEGNYWHPGTVHQHSDTTILAVRNSKVRFFTFDRSNETLTQTAEIELNSKLSDINQFTSIEYAKVFGSNLLIKANNKLHLFSIGNNTLTYLDTAAAGINGFTELPDLASTTEMNGHLLVHNIYTGTVQEFSVVNNKLKQRDLFTAPQPNSYITQLRFVSGQVHAQVNSTLYVYKEIAGQFRLLSLNNLPNQSIYYLDDRLVLIPEDGFSVKIAKLDLESGIAVEQHTMDFADYLNLRHAFMLGQHLYLEANYTPLTLKRYLVNRAPDLTQIQAPMQFNQGVSYSIELTSLIQDADANDTLSFSLVNAVTGITVTEQGTLTYDGSPLSASTVIVRATDNTGLYSDITLAFDHNKAPALAQAWIAPVLNQNKAFVLDLNEYFADPEGSVLSYEITSTANLTVTTKGIVSGTIASGQVHQLTVVVKDSKGATSSHTLDLSVNAAPVLSGSGNLTMSTDETVSINLTSLFTDAEGQSISFSASSLPAGLTLSGSTISGKVTTAGSFSTLITATDSAGATSQTTLNFVATEPKSSGGSSGWISVFALIALALSRRFRKV
ncbi:putative Ig domain-containing protein [Rheinheimera sp. 1928-s]|uniref:putative Ig domain-containing protein n=1 Tax=Rheinheimera sp. 1928-s TaxID=3033803 RepID=UPI00262C10FF|nr:putative Ig domain-containing protein [Rheinheimera sp. 1928-s]MDF3126818.1 putative Ig domain-containing protein [Rheinheimera sp. 1928-s]